LLLCTIILLFIYLFSKAVNDSEINTDVDLKNIKLKIKVKPRD